MIKKLFLVLFVSALLFGSNQCISCHGGIEHIRVDDSGMMKAIFEVAEKAGHTGNDCIVCHGGNPTTKNKSKAHSGTVAYFKNNKGPKEFYPAPASPWVNQNSCGACHPNQVSAQMNSLMMSESGKIQSTLWNFGGKNGHNHDIGTSATTNPEDLHTRLGTEAYQKYMQMLSSKEPQVFAKELKKLPSAPSADEVGRDPSLAVYTYLRQECLKCHTGSKGDAKSESFRGLGCASCHIPYAKDGLYAGDDKSISKKKAGHLLVHSIQSSREAIVKVHDKEYSGVPTETCASCHSEGKSIGLSYQGLMQAESGQKKYLHMQEDIHFKKGMLCQDCHTSNDLHGDGFLSGANATSVEVECQDCHGTTSSYPWDLPLGYSDEFNATVVSGKARGVAKTVAEYLKQGSVTEAKEGYLLSARGNPLVHAEKNGDSVLVHLANGKDIELSPLKKLKLDNKLSQKAVVAMDGISAHRDELECYSCHTLWAPQNYGLNVTIDYSLGAKNPDFLKASLDYDIHGKTGEMRNLKKYLIDGKISQIKGITRWTSPILVQNGEGRISPALPEHQANFTVIGKEGNLLLQNYIYKLSHDEDKKGVAAMSISPAQPHTISKNSRSCEDCHTNPKTMGFGMGSIDFDYAKIIDKNAGQLQSVGTHFKLSAPLSKAQREKLDRSGVCFSCHMDIPKGNLAISAITHMSKMLEIKQDNDTHKIILNKATNLNAWVQVLGGGFIVLLVVFGIYTTFFKKQPRNPRNEGWK